MHVMTIFIMTFLLISGCGTPKSTRPHPKPKSELSHQGTNVSKKIDEMDNFFGGGERDIKQSQTYDHSKPKPKKAPSMEVKSEPESFSKLTQTEPVHTEPTQTDASQNIKLNTPVKGFVGNDNKSIT